VALIGRSPRPLQPRTVMSAKVALAVVGLGTWFYGHYVDDPRVRWLGIVFLAVAFLLRFARRNPPGAGE
jgi:hypothetical protein